MSEAKSKVKGTISLEEEYASKPIPMEFRKTWKYSASIYMGMAAVLSASMAGGGLISNLTFTQSLWSLLLGLAVLVFVFLFRLVKLVQTKDLIPIL